MDDEVEIVEDGMSPLDFLEAVYSNADLDLNVRLRAAIAAAQYRHPKLAAATNLNMNVDLGARLDQMAEAKFLAGEIRAGAIGRASSVIEGQRRIGQVSEAQVQHSPAELGHTNLGFRRRV
jgi:hypothetical protein